MPVLKLKTCCKRFQFTS